MLEATMSGMLGDPAGARAVLLLAGRCRMCAWTVAVIEGLWDSEWQQQCGVCTHHLYAGEA